MSKLKQKLLVMLLLLSVTIQAQVGIGTTTPKATLEVVGDAATTTIPDGVIVPRLTGNELKAKDAAYTVDQNGALVYITAAASPTTAKTANVLTAGYYYYNSTDALWFAVGKVTTSSKSFYMPTIAFNTTVNAVGQTKNLYTEYLNQFTTPAIKSTGAPNSIPTYAATDLYYYITSYDTGVFSNVSIDANGVMSYDVTAAATECSFVSIVFVPKN